MGRKERKDREIKRENYATKHSAEKKKTDPYSSRRSIRNPCYSWICIIFVFDNDC